MLRKLLRLAVPAGVATVGIWFMIAARGPGPENAARQTLIRSLIEGTRVFDSENSTVSGSTASTPVTVRLADIPAGVYDSQNQYDRWLRGEIDLDENETIRSQAEIAALQQAALALVPEPLLQRGVTAVHQQAPAASLAIDSIDYTECCGGGGGNVPPDPHLAVGPGHLIAVVNAALEVYDKQGNSLLGPVTFSSFMAEVPGCTNMFDPNALYDEEADRYVLGIDAAGTHYCLAVSQTADPTGAWNIYAFQTGSSTLFFDYPHAGIGRDAIYMGANMFGQTFLDSRIWAFDKWAMYEGKAVTPVMKNLGGNDDTPQPLHLSGWGQKTWPADGPHYILTETGYNGRDYTVWAWDDPFGDNVLTAVGTINLNSASGITAGFPVNAPQKDGSAIQANDWRPQDFEYRNGYAWTTMTVACNPGGGTVNCVRWAQIDPATATVIQAGVLASDEEHRIFSDLAVNHCDDMVIGYSKTGAEIYPSIWYTGREGDDPAGALRAETEIKPGEIFYTSFEMFPPRRWGDYTEMRVDPDGVTFWYLGQYSKDTGTSNGRWGTYISALDFGSCTPMTEPDPTKTPQPDPLLFLPLISNN